MGNHGKPDFGFIQQVIQNDVQRHLGPQAVIVQKVNDRFAGLQQPGRFFILSLGKIEINPVALNHLQGIGRMRQRQSQTNDSENNSNDHAFSRSLHQFWVCIFRVQSLSMTPDLSHVITLRIFNVLNNEGSRLEMMLMQEGAEYQVCKKCSLKGPSANFKPE